MTSALAAHQSGQLEFAAQRYRRILEIEPAHASALHFLGVIAYQQEDYPQAADLIKQAIHENPSDPASYCNLGLVQQELGQLEEAASSFDKAIALAPGHSDAYYNLGIVRGEQYRLAEAENCYRKAIQLDPGHDQALGNLGAICHLQDRVDEAIKCYRTILGRSTATADIYRNLGDALIQNREIAEAKSCFEKSFELDPQDARAVSRLSKAVRELGRIDEAIEYACRAIEIDPLLPEAHRNLGQAYKEAGNLNEACRSYRTGLFYRRKPGDTDREGLFTFTQTSGAKLRHDIEQLEYLLEKQLVDQSCREALQEYRTVLGELEKRSLSTTELINLPAELRQRIAPTYNRLVNLYEAPALKGGAVNRDLDSAVIEANYRENAPGITFFDDFLTPEALDEVRRVCLESTIWYDFKHVNGYVGAYMQDGFCCPLLIQIAEELPRALPGIFGNHRLLQLWAYKYDSELDGIEMHADFAAINVNFWITPSQANRDPGTGGLIIWDKEAPLDWGIDQYNSSEREDQQAIVDFLDQSKATAITVPHRQNRVVVFNSDLFHKTDGIHFLEGYENRRINITMLYGRREDSEK